MRVHERYSAYMADQRQFFDDLVSEEWDSYLSEAWDAMRRHEVARLFEVVQPRRILDIGCGCGFHDRVMAEYPFVEQVDAFDYSAKSIEKADEEYPHKKVRRFVADMQRFEARAPYDLAVSFHVFEHLDAVAPYFALCHRALRPGGHMAIVMPNRWRLSNVLRRLKLQEPILLDPQHFREYSARAAMRLGEAAGFTPVARFGYGLAGTGIGWIDRAPPERQLRLARLVPTVANGIGIIMRRP